MKSLEVDALKAQAVIGLAKEMQEKSKLPTVPDTGVPGQLGGWVNLSPRGRGRIFHPRGEGTYLSPPGGGEYPNSGTSLRIC